MTDQEVAASLVGRTIVEATLTDEPSSRFTGNDRLRLALDDGRTVDVVSHGWHDISGLIIEER